MTSSPRADREVLSLVRLLNSLLLALGIALLLADCKKPSATAAVDPNGPVEVAIPEHGVYTGAFMDFGDAEDDVTLETVSYTHLRAHETPEHLVCRLLLEKKKK